MANIYGRVNKITNVIGRSEYITDAKRQEEIVLHKSEMKYSWSEHSNFEKNNKKTNIENNEALEIHIALPNSLSKDKEKLEQVCDDLALNIVGVNKDYEYAVHWNHNRTNLHVHILFSERENQLELEHKIYKKDIWHDKDTHKLAKANAENAVLVYKKGDIQRDKEGNIKYETDVFKAKDKKFTEMGWVHEKNKIIESVMKSYGYELNYQDKDSPYLSQKKLYKGASTDYLEKAKEWNKEVQRYNEGVKQHIQLEPNQLENYKTIKKELLENVKEANAEEKKITPQAINLINDMANWVHQTLNQLKLFIKSKAKELKTIERWKEIKNNFFDKYHENKNIETKIKSFNQEINTYEKAYDELTEVIKSKKELIYDIEEYEDRLNQLEKRAYKGYSWTEYSNAINDLSFEERMKKAEEIVKNQLSLERSRSYGLDR